MLINNNNRIQPMKDIFLLIFVFFSIRSDDRKTTSDKILIHMNYVNFAILLLLKKD